MCIIQSCVSFFGQSFPRFIPSTGGRICWSVFLIVAFSNLSARNVFKGIVLVTDFNSPTAPYSGVSAIKLLTTSSKVSPSSASISPMIDEIDALSAGISSLIAKNICEVLPICIIMGNTDFKEGMRPCSLYCL